MRKHRAGLAAAALCAALLALGAATLAKLTAPGGPPSVRGGPADGENEPDMVLLDIADQEAADYYHVEALGVYVLAVDEQSRAYAAGVRSGDRIVSANGVEIASSGEFSALRASLEASAALVLLLERGLEDERLTVTMLEDTDARLSRLFRNQPAGGGICA